MMKSLPVPFLLAVLLSSAIVLAPRLAAIAGEVARFADDSFADFSAGAADDGGHNLYVARDGSVRTIQRFDLNDDGYLDVLFNCTHNTYQMLPATVGQVGRDRTTISASLAVEGAQQCVAADLDSDGYSDLVFCPNGIGVHHDRRFVMVSWGGPDGWSAQRISSPLPMNAASKVEVVDLNGDGQLDIAVLGAARWTPDQPDGKIIRIYWGSSLGFSVISKLDLGVPNAIDLAAGDLDGDGYRDLVVLRSDSRCTLVWSGNGPTPIGPKPAVSGSATRLNAKPNTTELALPQAQYSCVAVGSLHNSSTQSPSTQSPSTQSPTRRGTASHLVFGGRAPEITIVESKRSGQWNNPVVVPASPATHITLADLDGDSFSDLTLTQFDQTRAAGGEQAGAGKNAKDIVRVLWGSSAGFTSDRCTNLEIPRAVATAAVDLDADGRMDLAVAIHQGLEAFQSESLVYFGDGQRQFARGGAVPTSGTLHVTAIPAEKQHPARVVFCNSIGGQLDEAVPLHLYWGGKDGFDPQRVWKIPFHSGYEASAADLNADGFTELIILNSGHAGDHSHADPTLGANILWGGPGGWEKNEKRSVLHEHFLGTSGIADLNRDGYLDMVLEPFAPERSGETEKLILYYGGADGLTEARRKILPVEGYAQEHLIADFNRDRWLDIAVTTRKFDCIRIFWGSELGFDPKREQRLLVSGPVGVDAADFNSDGWLDVLAGSYNDPVSGHRDMGSILFWGSPQGFHHARSQWLPGFSPLGRTVADLDRDGWLDLVSPQHSGELTREDLACHIYWGAKDGFATRRRTTFFSDSVNDTMAADFNSDGLIDLAVNGHTRHGDHRTQSRILYNDGNRFEQPRIQRLPTNGPHLMWAEDVGNIYDRRYRESFTSRVFTWSTSARRGTIVSRGKSPPGTKLQFSIRSAADSKSLETCEWELLDKDLFRLTPDKRCLQYRATLQSDNGDRYPILDGVEIVIND